MCCVSSGGRRVYCGYESEEAVNPETKVATLTGPNADDVLAQAKARVTKELGWKGLFLNALSPLAFAQKAVALYNSAHTTAYAEPKSADEFFLLGKDLGYNTVLEE